MDLSSRVVVGEPVQKSPVLWSVSYNVMDDAGNAAKTVWRDVLIEEVDLFDVENKVRAEMRAERDAEINEAVNKAVAEDRALREQVEVVAGTQDNKRTGRARGGGTAKTCPACPPCECPTSGSFDPALCDEYCEKKMAEGGSCLPGEAPFPGPLQFLQDILPSQVIFVLAWCLAVSAFIASLRFCLTAIFNPRAYDTHNYSGAEEQELQNAVRYYGSPPGSAASQSNPFIPPPTPASGAFGATNGFRNETPFFSPENRPQDRMNVPPFWSPPASNSSRQPQGTPGTASRQSNAYDDSIYQESSVRTPRQRR